MKSKMVSNDIYTRSVLTRDVPLHITNVGKHIHATLNQYIKDNFEGKCVAEGFVKPGSSSLVNYSSGVVKGSNVIFQTAFECQVCLPVEGMNITCIAKNITKAGIRAEVLGDKNMPIVAFITRDHHYNMAYFSTIKENNTINIRVIGQRFELNDPYISVIGELIEK